MSRQVQGGLLSLALLLIVLSIPAPISVAVAAVGLALALALASTGVIYVLTERLDWGRLVRKHDYVDEATAARLRASSEAEADLEQSLGIAAPRKRPEPVQRAASASGAFSKPWSSQ